MPNDPSETNVLHDAAKAGARDGATTAAPAGTPTGPPTGVGAYHPGAGPLSDTDEISTGAVRDEREPASADGYEDAHDDGDDDYEEEGGLFEWIWDHWYVLLMVAAVALVAVIVAGRVFGGGGEADAPPAPAGTQTETKNVAPETAPLRATDTGVVFGEPVIKGDTYYLRAGQIAWKGRTQKTDTGTEVTLEGPTAAQFKESVSIPGGSITTGVFGRAEPGKPILHATFHMTEVGGREYASGTYYAVGSGSVVVEGTYEDTRDGQKVTRVYTEHAPGSTDFERYAVTFEAPEGALVPVLVGWKPPAAVEQEAAG